MISLQTDKEGHFYKQEDVERLHGVKYIFCPRVWSGKIPHEESVTKFFNEVDHMLEKNSNALIGVHCTHGVNRTGYMICRYLIEKLNWPAQKAIDEFNKNRGHQIEHKFLLDDLKSGNWNNISGTEKPEKSNQNPVDNPGSKVGRSISLNVPQDSGKDRRYSALVSNKLEPETSRNSVSPRVARSKSTVDPSVMAKAVSNLAPVSKSSSKVSKQSSADVVLDSAGAETSKKSSSTISGTKVKLRVPTPSKQSSLDDSSSPSGSNSGSKSRLNVPRQDAVDETET